MEMDGLPERVIRSLPVTGQAVELRPVAGGEDGQLREDLAGISKMGVERTHLVRTHLDLVPDFRRGGLEVCAKYDEIHVPYEN